MYVAMLCYCDCEHLLPWDPDCLGVFPTYDEAKRSIEQYLNAHPNHGYDEGYVLCPSAKMFYSWDCVYYRCTVDGD